jgi:hypothetical protein
MPYNESKKVAIHESEIITQQREDYFEGWMRRKRKRRCQEYFKALGGVR